MQVENKSMIYQTESDISDFVETKNIYFNTFGRKEIIIMLYTCLVFERKILRRISVTDNFGAAA